MRKFIKVFTVIGLIASQFLLSNNIGSVVKEEENKKVDAAVTMPAIPTVRNEITTGITADVSNAAEFIAAYTTTSVKIINFTNNITLTEANRTTIFGTIITRSLKINGNGHTLSSPNSTFRVGSNNAVGTTFHISNMVIDKQVNVNAGDFIYGGGPTTDIILENLSNSATGVRWGRIGNSNETNNSNVFLRGSIDKLAYDAEFWWGAGVVVIEANANFNDPMQTGQNSATFHSPNAIGKVYFGPGSKTYILGGAGWAVFEAYVETNIYANAEVFFESKVGNLEGVIDASYTASQIYRVDNGAKFKVLNANGEAFSDYNVKAEFYFNPNTVIEFIGSNANVEGGSFHFGHPDSKVVLESPRYFDFRNNSTNFPAFYPIYAGNQYIQIRDAYVGLWAKGAANVGVNPTLPSPFFDGNGNATKVNLITGRTTLDPSSSSVFSTMPGGYSGDKYSRIATSVNPIFNTGNVTMNLTDAPRQILLNLVQPNEVSWTFNGYDPAVISVSSTGVITPLKAGDTKVNISATGSDNYTTIKTIDVKVIGIPTITVTPGIVNVPLNGTLSNYYTGVSAVDGTGASIPVTHSGSVNTSLNGSYHVTYSAVDSNNITATNSRTYLVGNSIVSGNYAIFAEDFTKRTGQVTDTSDTAILNDAKVKVFDITTGTQIPNNTLTFNINKGSYGATVGTYPISIATTANGTPLNITINAHVNSGTAPTLVVPSFTEINVGASFSQWTGVSATDAQDGVITGNIVTTGVVDANTAGVYRIDYSITDSDGNIATKSQVVLVNDGDYAVGTNYILHASDFTNRYSQTTSITLQINAYANTKVYNKLTGAEVTGLVLTQTRNGYGANAELGTYTINFRLNVEPTLNINVLATVIAGEPPVISTPAFTEVTVGSAFDPMSGVSATDPEQGNLTSSIQVTGTVDTNVAGVYKLTYKVTDADRNSDTETRIVVVQDGNIVVGNTYIIDANNFSKRVSQVNTADNAIKTDADVKVYNRVTGDLATPNVSVSKGGYTNVAGSYPITFTVDTDTAARVSIIGTVTSGNPPVINGAVFTEISINDAFDPIQGITVTDDFDTGLIPTVTGLVNVNVAGVYPLTYSATDSDNNTTTVQRVVVVNDGNFVSGSNYIIKANDFSKYISTVSLDDNVIKNDASLQVYNMLTGALISTPVSINKGSYTNVEGTYPIIFTVTADPTATISVNAIVSTGSVPVITAPEFTQINVSDLFNPMTGVSATDPEQGNLTSSIITTGVVNTSVAGVYTLNYHVTDNDGNIDAKTRVVVVSDGSFVTGDNFIIKSNSFTKRIGQVNTSDSAVIADSNTVVYNKLTGEIVNEPLTINKGGYTNVAGSYPITFTVTSDPTTSIGVTGNVVTGSSPILTTTSFQQVTLNSTFDSLFGTSAADAEDGAYNSNQIIVTGSVNTAVAGFYNLTYSITDSDNNTTTKNKVVLVNDSSYTVGTNFILKASDFTRYVSGVNTSNSSVISAASAVVYSKTTGLPVLEPISVNNGGYNNVVGSYSIAFGVISEPTVSKTVIGSVISGDVPVITAPTYTEVVIGSTFNPFDGVSGFDTEDGDLTSEIQFTGPVELDVAGVYKITYILIDSDNNRVTSDRVIVVNDGTYTAGNNYIINANNFSNLVSNVDTSDSAIISDANARVFDKFTGELVSVPINVNKTGYTNIVGNYPISFAVASDLTAAVNVNARVVAGGVPTLVVDDYIEIGVGGVFNPTTIVVASDVEDDANNIPLNVIYSGTFDVNTAGIYPLTFQVTDSDGNTVTQRSVLVVNDGSFTEGNNFIIKASDFTRRVGQVDTLNSAVIAAGNVLVYDKLTGSLVNEAITVVNGGYSPIPNTYNIDYTVTSDPTTTTSVIGTVISGNNPVLNVTPFERIELNGTFNYNIGVSATDTEDGTLIATNTGTVDTSVAGLYNLVYSVTDSDGNSVSANRVVLVQDGSYAIGTNFILKANNFTNLVSEVNTSDAAIITDANVEVYSIVTGALVPEIVNVNKTGYTNIPGNYSITFTVASDLTASRNIIGTVTNGNIPVLTVPAYTEVLVGGAFNPMTGVSATDVEDSTLTINNTGVVNTSVAGVYRVNYSVVDSDNNTVTAHQIVVVNDGSYTAGNNFIIKATDFSKRVSEVDTSDTAIKVNSALEVHDKLSGALVNKAVVFNKGGYTNTVGMYPMTASVVSDPSAVVAFNAEVVAGDVPDIIGANLTQLSVGDLFNPMTGVSATDNEDNDLTSSIIYTGVVNTAQAGLYSLTYSVSDSDGNRTNVTRVIVVNDGSFIVGTNFALAASNFTNYVKDVDLTDAAIIADANARVYSLSTGELTNEALIVDRGTYSTTPNVYSIKFTVANELTLEKTVQGTVLAGNAPVILASDFEQIGLNAVYNPILGVSATDVEDGNITASITQTGTVDTTIAGLYQVTYFVTDADQNTVSKVKTILVNDNSYVVGANFILKAANFTRNVSQVDTSDSAILTAADVKVYNKLTMQEVSEPVTINKGAYNAAVGSYPITFTVTSDLLATKQIMANIVGGNAPTLTVPAFTQISLGSSFDPMLGVSATDIEDGNMTLNITNNSTVDVNDAGVYTVVYQVTDSDNNLVTATQVVLVQDGTYVDGLNYIIQADSFTKRSGQVVTTDEAVIANGLVAVYDKLSGQLVDQPILVNQGGYSPTVGTYSITYSVTAEQTTAITINANVISGLAPVITGANTSDIPVGSLFNVMTGITAVDAEDGVIPSNQIVVSGSVNTSNPGVYFITYSVTDSDNNVTQVSRSVVVNDGSLVIDGIYAIQARDFVIRVDLVNSTDAMLISEAGVKVFDLTTGNEILNPVIGVNSAGYTNVVGEYPITFSYNPEITIIAHVVPNLAPELTVPFAEVKPGSTVDPITGVIAFDDEDGNLIDSVIYGAIPDVSKPGIYKMQYAVTDSFGNTTVQERIILVNDGSYVVDGDYIFKANDFSIYESQVIDTSDELVKLSGLEIYDKLTGDRIDTGYMVSDGGYSSTPGVYDITFTIGNGSITIKGTVLADSNELANTGSMNSLLYVFGISTLLIVLYKRKISNK